MTLPGDHTLPLSVAVITRDEERNLGRCLDSVAGLAAEIVVVDSGSTDATLRIAASHGARILEREWPGYCTQKNRALDACSQRWVLSLDADEALSEELAADLRRHLEGTDPTALGFELNRRTWYLGDWVWHAWYPEWRLRLVRRGRARWTGGELHESMSIDGATERLSGDLLHYSYDDVEDHFRRTVTYARLAGEQMMAEGRRFRLHKLVVSPWARLIRSLVIRQAWRDGARGWVIAYSSMFAGFLKYAFLLEKQIASRSRQSRDNGE